MYKPLKISILILFIFLFLSVSFSREVVTLRISWWGSQDRHNRTLKVIELFQQKYPYIKIVPEYAGWGDYWTKLNTQAAGRNLPDIIQHDAQYLKDWVEKKLLLPLEDLVAQKSLNISDIPEPYLAPGRVGGKLYAINLGVNSLAIAYDPALFKKAGVPLPKWDWTWEDFKKIALQIKNKLGIYGIGETIVSNILFENWLWAHKVWLFSDDGKSLGYEDDKLFSEYFRMALELQESGACPTRESEIARGSVGIEDRFIVTQKSAMSYLWSNQLVAVMRAAKERPIKLNTIPLPGKPGTRSGNFLKASMFFTISAQTKYPKESAMFIDFFVNSIEANKILLAERGIPVSKKIQILLRPYLPSAQVEALNFIKTVEKYGAPTPPLLPPGANEVYSNAYAPLVDQILYKKITPEQGAKEFRRLVNEILSQR
ncbi:MAG: extracellular solute-binding protein [Dictyoglomaceae bacterium]|nr:extracellular solute-binding protein [Dictyoglomaceae bacterium]